MPKQSLKCYFIIHKGYLDSIEKAPIGFVYTLKAVCQILCMNVLTTILQELMGRATLSLPVGCFTFVFLIVKKQRENKGVPDQS